MTEQVEADATVCRGGIEFESLVAEFRRMHAALCAAAPDSGLTAALQREFRDVANRLESTRQPVESDRASWRIGMSSRGHPTLVPFDVEHLDEHVFRARLEFSDVHLGGNGAVHGGTIPLLFDDFLGMFVSAKGQPHSRTAFLKVNYRRITPIYTPLLVEGTIDRIEGRKTWVSGRLLHGSEITADAEALFLRLLPGQP
ncbi:Thioesterase superfamily protein [Rhodococcus rhodochrous J3]|uniref:Acyl-coenzyme A thioesterase THEM4 n=2 Tax=Rhodococcus rhodochrous TaxID=1829 RepID=A0AA46X1C7_RHORH|nr:PaaI family thioesterase [Rhodococcus rhodochrous]MBF4476507.1 PaaI family thioesterase [Rhodococcus rhodochrous]MCD2099290.1 PaaI family thioesterase [Rhodococcus rhodochrous]MCD2123705.1 PaaI family thioesterase [Rhodococcus rhodochrous]MCQ4136266.1 PaaI family thioesterase [Rhodococcus rhodochrous]MDJ0020501.1 PaaI family thioesterase [Rhodococcus rhodochrous]